MINFKELRSQIDESARMINEKNVDTFTVGKDKLKAEIKKKGSKYTAYVDGDELDEFKSEDEARQGIKDFVKLMDV